MSYGNPYRENPCLGHLFWRRAIRRPFKKAPFPVLHETTRPRRGHKPLPVRPSPSTSSAMETQKHGNPLKVVRRPSRGSMIHFHGTPVPVKGLSSVRISCSGNAPRIHLDDGLFRNACPLRSLDRFLLCTLPCSFAENAVLNTARFFSRRYCQFKITMMVFFLPHVTRSPCERPFLELTASSVRLYDTWNCKSSFDTRAKALGLLRIDPERHLCTLPSKQGLAPPNGSTNWSEQ